MGVFSKVCVFQLLVAVCRDGNNQMLPISWAVVEVENQYTWTWFLELMNNDLEIGEGHQLSIISDMQKVITDIHLTILLLLSFALKLILFLLCWFVRDQKLLWILYCHLLNIENVQDMFLQIGQKIGKELKEEECFGGLLNPHLKLS